MASRHRRRLRHRRHKARTRKHRVQRQVRAWEKANGIDIPFAFVDGPSQPIGVDEAKDTVAGF